MHGVHPSFSWSGGVSGMGTGLEVEVLYGAPINELPLRYE